MSFIHIKHISLIFLLSVLSEERRIWSKVYNGINLGCLTVQYSGSPEIRMRKPGGTLKLTDQNSNFRNWKTQVHKTKDLLRVIQLGGGTIGTSPQVLCV